MLPSRRAFKGLVTRERHKLEVSHHRVVRLHKMEGWRCSLPPESMEEPTFLPGVEWRAI
jgi:hypothetical protein